MNAMSYYEQIMDLPGLEEMKEVVRQWDQVARNLPHQVADAPLVLPDLMWKASPGAGKTHFLQLLSEYLDAARLLDFYGDVRFMEFYLEYCPPGMDLSELTRLIGDVRGAAGFRSEYRGLLAIDITEWEDAMEEANFLRVLEYLSSIDEKVLIIFVVEDFSKPAATRTEQILSSYCRIRSVDFSYPRDEAFSVYCASRLMQYRIQLDEGARRLLTESISELMKSDYFDGYKTVNRLCQDIVFALCSTPDIQRSPVTEAHLAAFRKDSPFVENLSKLERARKIGFGGER